jgi:hypothetical protein
MPFCLFTYVFGGATAHIASMFRILELTRLDTQQNNELKRRTFMPSAGFENAILEIEWPQIYAFNLTATRIKSPLS